MAIEYITTPMIKSKIFQAIALEKNGLKNLAPKLKEKNQIIEAIIAPRVNDIFAWVEKSELILAINMQLSK